MLAAQVQPHNEQDCVKVSIAFTHENIVRFEKSCLTDPSYVYKGLPEEYVDRVIDHICSVILEKESYPQCHIIIENAANCEVGSSPVFFGMIAEIIANIICTGSEAEIQNMDIETFNIQYVKNDFIRLYK